MIVGLKYAGASDGFPARISVGDTVRLRLEGTEVSAYHKDKKVGYLTPDKRRLWNSLRPSTRTRATVVGEIVDEEGNIAGLDVEIPTRSAGAPPRTQNRTGPREAPKIDSGSRVYRAALGVAVLLSSIAVMGHASSTGPILARVNVASSGPAIDDDRELRRQAQLASAHRLSDEMRKREAAAEVKLQAEEEKVIGLQAALEQAEQASALQLKRIEELEDESRQAAVRQDAESLRLNGEIAALQQKIEHLALEKQKIEEEERQAALRDINDQELLRHRNQLTAWMVMSRVEQLKAILKNRTVLEQPKPEERAVAVPRTAAAPQSETKQQAEKSNSAEKSSKQAEEVQVKKKTNFSRYAQDYEEPAGSTNR
jgi:hypothetical protein